MFLHATLRRNAPLVNAAVQLHGAGRIPANCYLIDLDTVRGNAAVLAARAGDLGLDCLQMTKQFGRNPIVSGGICGAGIPQAVAVDMDEACILHAAGIDIGHLGHLVQVPQSRLIEAMGLAPAQLTVFGVEQARRVSAAARHAGRQQPILLRVVGPDDFFYPAQRGGVELADLADSVREVQQLEGLSFAGLTSFPCMLWDDRRRRVQATPNLATLGAAARLLTREGIETHVLNTPGVNCVATLDELAAAGSTQVEPGSALLGQTPLHAATEQPEVPAMVYVSEVTHNLGETTFTLGGGFYARSQARYALVATASGRHIASVLPSPPGEIDYYGAVRLPDRVRADVGDTVVYSFRSQVFVTRAAVAVVSGLPGGPNVLGIFGPDGRPARPRKAKPFKGSHVIPEVRPPKAATECPVTYPGSRS